jgi:hypothetical protein
LWWRRSLGIYARLTPRITRSGHPSIEDSVETGAIFTHQAPSQRAKRRIRSKRLLAAHAVGMRLSCQKHAGVQWRWFRRAKTLRPIRSPSAGTQAQGFETQSQRLGLRAAPSRGGLSMAWSRSTAAPGRYGRRGVAAAGTMPPGVPFAPPIQRDCPRTDPAKHAVRRQTAFAATPASLLPTACLNVFLDRNPPAT